jgi:hypothetical protein
MFESVSIVLVGKYTSLQDSYMSVVKALEHASMRCGRKLILEVSCMDHRCVAQGRDLISFSVGGLVRSRASSSGQRSGQVPRCVEGALLCQVSGPAARIIYVLTPTLGVSSFPVASVNEALRV